MSNHEEMQETIKKEIFEIATNIGEIVNNYKKLKSPLMESQEKVPRATDHLDKINEQTEAAAQRMLDTVEKITQREEELIQGLNLIRDDVTGNNVKKIKKIIDGLIKKATENSNDTFAIMDALQFQDITSQQLNYAVHMLEDLQTKIGNIVTVMNGEDVPVEKDNNHINTATVYDPNADMFTKKTEQTDIDDIFAKKS